MKKVSLSVSEGYAGSSTKYALAKEYQYFCGALPFGSSKAFPALWHAIMPLLLAWKSR